MATTHRLLIWLVSISGMFFSVLAIPLDKWKVLATVKELNRKGPYLGLITVYSPEEDAFFAAGAFIPDQKHPFVDLSGLHIVIVNCIYVCMYFTFWYVKRGIHCSREAFSHWKN